MTTFAVLAIVKATLVCGVALLLSHVCRRARASIRHLLFALAFAALAAIPAVMLFAPVVAITVPAPIIATLDPSEDRVAARSTGAISFGSAPSATGVPARSMHSEMPGRQGSIFAEVATAIWLAGVVLFLMPVAAGLWQLRRLRRTAAPWPRGQEVVQSHAVSMRIHRRIDVLLHDAVAGPMTCGALRPAIIVPPGANKWDETSLMCALRHEFEHVARRDFFTHCLSRAICAAYWFHPLVWMMWGRLRLEAERACDDAVLSEHDARDYAALLVSTAQLDITTLRRSVLAMAGRDDLATRIAALLDDDHARGRIGHWRSAGFIVMAALTILSVAAMTVARELPQTQGNATGASLLRFESVSLTRNRDDDVQRQLFFLTEHADGKPGVGPDGRVLWFSATNVTARFLIWSAFGADLRRDRASGLHLIDNAPEWVDADRFDVLAKAPSRATPQQMNQMMQLLLAERFNLVAHLGAKDFPLYALVLSRADGNPGPRMTLSQLDCTAPGSRCGLASTAGRLVGRGITMPQLVTLLPNHIGGAHHIPLDRRLIDRTGLSAAFDFILEWTPDPISPEVRAPSQAPRLLQPRFFSFPLESTAPNFLAALDTQLGLLLDNQWSEDPVLVLDRIERPSVD